MRNTSKLELLHTIASTCYCAIILMPMAIKKLTAVAFRRIIKEELEDAEIMSRLSTHRGNVRKAWEDEPAPKEGPGIEPNDVQRKHPGALEAFPEDADRYRFWEEGGMLMAVDDAMGHKTQMMFGKGDKQWHKYFNAAKPETVDRRKGGRTMSLESLKRVIKRAVKESKK